MPRDKRTKSETGIYHVTNRGANRQEIFHDNEDFRRYLDTFARYKKLSGMKVYSWCLMNNHVHLLVREGRESLSETMKRIGISFVQYYHGKYGTTGRLCQDRFRSENVDTDKYLLTVVRYIHQNPVKAGMTQRVDDWQWSSCHGYYGKKCYPSDLLDRYYVLQKFSPNLEIAKERFIEFNERKNNDECLEDKVNEKRKLTDDEAREKIKAILGPIAITQVKSLPKAERDELLRNIKEIKEVSQRQAARILGISPQLINRA